jgi:NAD(P)H-dependent FMN reductase
MTSARILAFAGSSRRDSWNRKVLAIAAEGARAAGAEVTVVNLGDFPMPIYNADLHKEQGLPPAMLELRALMMAANGVLIASPEYNTSITPLLKNTIDWLSQEANGESGKAPFEGKVGGLMGASNGAFGTIRALPHVSHILANLGVLMLPVLAVPGVSKAFDESGNMTNERTRNSLTGLGARLARTIVSLGSDPKGGSPKP